MKLDLKIKAVCSNVRNIFIDPVVCARLKCTFDNKQHEKNVTITSESIQRNDKNQAINFKMKCDDCTRVMVVNMFMSEKNKHDHWSSDETQCDTIFLSEKVDDEFMVAKFESNGCVIESIVGLKINVLAEDDTLFEDIEIVDEYWCGHQKNLDPVTVSDLTWELVETKKKKK